MYKCKCGYESNSVDYCEKCNLVLKCDCSDIKTNYQDIEAVYQDFRKDRSFTIEYKICNTCGKLFDVSIDRNLIAKLKQRRK